MLSANRSTGLVTRRGLATSQEFFRDEDYINLDDEMEEDEQEDSDMEENPRLDLVKKDISNLKSDILARRPFDTLVTAKCRTQS